MYNMRASLKYLIKLSKHNFKSQYNSMQNVAYRLEYMKFYFQVNETRKYGKNRFHEVQSSSLINILFSMKENLYNARGKSGTRMHML